MIFTKILLGKGPKTSKVIPLRDNPLAFSFGVWFYMLSSLMKMILFSIFYYFLSSFSFNSLTSLWELFLNICKCIVNKVNIPHFLFFVLWFLFYYFLGCSFSSLHFILVTHSTSDTNILFLFLLPFRSPFIWHYRFTSLKHPIKSFQPRFFPSTNRGFCFLCDSSIITEETKLGMT